MSPVLAGTGLLAIVAGAVAGTGLFLFVVAMRGLPPRPPGDTGRLRRWAQETGPSRAVAAVVAGLLVLVVTRASPFTRSVSVFTLLKLSASVEAHRLRKVPGMSIVRCTRASTVPAIESWPSSGA